MIKNKTNYTALIILIILGYLGNYFKIELFFGVDFLFGSIFVWLVSYLFGMNWGITSGVIASICTRFLWGHNYAIIIFTCEAIFVNFFSRKKRHNLLYFDIIYWTCIGIPLVAFFYGAILQVSATGTWLIMFKQSVNGVFNALIANLIIISFPVDKWFKTRSKRQVISFEKTLFIILTTFVLIPVLTLTILTINDHLKYIEKDLNNQLVLASDFLINDINHWTDMHINALKLLSQENVTDNRLKQEKIDLIHQNFPSLSKIYLTDEKGVIVAFSQDKNTKEKMLIGQNISDQDKVKKSKATLQTIITNVHQDKENVNDHIGIMIPIIKNKQWSGMIYGSINTNDFNRFLQLHKQLENISFLILDRK